MGYRVSEKIEVNVADDIFKFLGTGNVCLSEISNSDRIVMFRMLDNYYLKLRNIIGISNDISFGLEIEFEEADKEIISDELEEKSLLDEWVMVSDGSLSNGAEINSPVLEDNEKTWIDLSCVCDVVDKNAYVLDNTSAHIHIGTQILGNNAKYWRNFALLWATYENIIFRFLYGEYVSHRSQIEEYARPVAFDYINDIDRIDDRVKNYIGAGYLFKVLDFGDDAKVLRRRKSVNFTNVSSLSPYIYNSRKEMNTVEFRSANGTFDPVIWQNNVNLITKMMLYCKSDKFNEDILNRRMKYIVNEDIASDIYKYAHINYNQAIEFADMIFDNNLDKVYFLRQYIKDGSVSNKPLVKSRKFTRR